MSQTEVYEHSAGGVVFQAGKVLLIEHSRGEWIMPKGHLEAEETPEEAAIREILEETSLQCQLGPELGETKYDFSRGEVIVHKKVTWFLASPSTDVAAARPRTEEGIIGLQWLSPQAAFLRLTFDLDRKILLKALEAVGLELK